jgi:hypothetical protein
MSAWRWVLAVSCCISYPELGQVTIWVSEMPTGSWKLGMGTLWCLSTHVISLLSLLRKVSNLPSSETSNERHRLPFLVLQPMTTSYWSVALGKAPCSLGHFYLLLKWRPSCQLAGVRAGESVQDVFAMRPSAELLDRWSCGYCSFLACGSPNAFSHLPLLGTLTSHPCSSTLQAGQFLFNPPWSLLGSPTWWPSGSQSHWVCPTQWTLAPTEDRSLSWIVVSPGLSILSNQQSICHKVDTWFYLSFEWFNVILLKNFYHNCP